MKKLEFKILAAKINQNYLKVIFMQVENAFERVASDYSEGQFMGQLLVSADYYKANKQQEFTCDYRDLRFELVDISFVKSNTFSYEIDLMTDSLSDSAKGLGRIKEENIFLLGVEELNPTISSQILARRPRIFYAKIDSDRSMERSSVISRILWQELSVRNWDS